MAGPKTAGLPLQDQIENTERHYADRISRRKATLAIAEEELRATAADYDERVRERMVSKKQKRVDALRAEIEGLPEQCARDVAALRVAFAEATIARHERTIATVAAGRVAALRLEAQALAEDAQALGAKPSALVASEVDRRVKEELKPYHEWLAHDALVSALREREHGSLVAAAHEACRTATEAAVARVAPVDAAVKQAHFFARHGEATYPALLEAFRQERERVESEEQAIREACEAERDATLREIGELPVDGAPKAPSCPRPADLEAWRKVLPEPAVVLPEVAPEPEPVLQEPDDPEPVLPRQLGPDFAAALEARRAWQSRREERQARGQAS